MPRTERVFEVAAAWTSDGGLISNCELLIDDGLLVRVLQVADTSDPANALRRRFLHAERVRLPYGLALPGLVNCHHHAYSALARGLKVSGPQGSFPDILANLWWRFDRVLDAEAVELCGLVTAADCVRHGCTSVIDHHASPTAIRGSLALLDHAFGALHLSRVLCFETSDRSGAVAREEAVAENLEFARSHEHDPHSRGLFGLHASFTLSDVTLDRLGRELPAALPIHIHVAEDACDVMHAERNGALGPLARLDRYGLLHQQSLLAHGVLLARRDGELFEQRSLYLVHNPESNANNRVGYPNLDALPAERLLLGTDGMSSNMLGALYTAFLLYCGWGQHGRDAGVLCQALLLENPRRYLQALFGRPVAALTEGAPADFAIFDYRTPTPLDTGTFTRHLLYGLPQAPLARYVYANGAAVLDDGVLVGVDETSLLDAAVKKSRALWAAYEQLAKG